MRAQRAFGNLKAKAEQLKSNYNGALLDLNTVDSFNLLLWDLGCLHPFAAYGKHDGELCQCCCTLPLADLGMLPLHPKSRKCYNT